MPSGGRELNMAHYSDWLEAQIQTIDGPLDEATRGLDCIGRSQARDKSSVEVYFRKEEDVAYINEAIDDYYAGALPNIKMVSIVTL